MSADELYGLASGNKIAKGVYGTKRKTRDVEIKIIENKEKAKTEIQEYENHDNTRNIVCLYDSSTEGDHGVLVLERAKCSLRELVDCLLWGNELEFPTTEKTEFMEGVERDTLWIESKKSRKTCDAAQLSKNKKPTP